MRRELRQSFPLISNLELDQLVGTICGSTRGEDIGTRPASERLCRIFATLCLISRPGSIQKFIEANVSDKDLPFAPEQLKRIVATDDAVQITPSDEHWDSKTREEFEAQQWKVLVPFFSQANTLDKVRFYDLDSKDILPFTTDKASQRVRTGGFGKVSIVNIHSAHHGFNRNQVILDCRKPRNKLIILGVDQLFCHQRTERKRRQRLCSRGEGPQCRSETPS